MIHENNKKPIEELLNFFNMCGVVVDSDIKSVLETAYSEGGFINEATTFVSFKNNPSKFCEDLTLDEELIVSIDDDDYINLRGKCYVRITYLDNVEYHSRGEVNVYDDGENVMGFEYRDNNDKNITTIPDLDEWSIVLLKSIELVDDKVNRVNKLYVYCPIEPKFRKEVSL